MNRDSGYTSKALSRWIFLVIVSGSILLFPLQTFSQESNVDHYTRYYLWCGNETDNSVQCARENDIPDSVISKWNKNPDEAPPGYEPPGNKKTVGSSVGGTEVDVSEPGRSDRTVQRTTTGQRKGALVNRVVRNVLYYEELERDYRPRPARPKQDVVGPKNAIRTGPKSRAELLMKDDSLIRVGSESMFSIHPESREAQLGEGTALFQVPKGSKKTQIHTATATAAITGTTVMIEQRPGEYAKSIVVEGSMDVSMPGRPGERRTLKAGQMLVIPAGANRLPEPVDVHLGELVNTSDLVQFEEEDSDGSTADPESPDQGEDAEEDPFNREQIADDLEEQESKIKDGELEPTNLVLEGEGLDVRPDEYEQGENDLQEFTERESDQTQEDVTETQDNSDGDPYNLDERDPVLINAQSTIDLGQVDPFEAPTIDGGNTGEILNILNPGDPPAEHTGPVLNFFLPEADAKNPIFADAPQRFGSAYSDLYDQAEFGVISKYITTFWFDDLHFEGFDEENFEGSRNLALVSDNNITSEVESIDISLIDSFTAITSGDNINWELPNFTWNHGTSTGPHLNLIARGSSSEISLGSVGSPNNLFVWLNSFSQGGQMVRSGEEIYAGDMNLSSKDYLTVGSNATLSGVGFLHLDTLNGDLTIRDNATVAGNGNLTLFSEKGTIAAESGSLIQSNFLTMSSYKDVHDEADPVITINDSSELVGLANESQDGFMRIFTQNSGHIEVNGATLKSQDELSGSVSEVNVDGYLGEKEDPANVNRSIDLTNANLMADEVKVHAFGSNGALTIGGGTLSANQALKLYGENNADVRFVDNSTIEAPNIVEIAGQTVQVDDGVEVSLKNHYPENFAIYSENHNYNKGGYGEFLNPDGDTYKQIFQENYGNATFQ